MKATDIATRNHISMDDLEEVCKELKIPFASEQELSDQNIFLIEKKIEVIKIKNAQKNEELKKNKKIKLKRKVQLPKEGEAEDAMPEEVPEKKPVSTEPKKKEQSESETKPPRPARPVAKPGQGSAPRSGQSSTARPGQGSAPRSGQGGTARPGQGGTARPGQGNRTGDQRPRRPDDKRFGGGAGGPQKDGRPPRDNRNKPTIGGAGATGAAPAVGSVIDPEELKKRKKGKEKEKDTKSKYKKEKFEEKSIELRKKQLYHAQKREAVPPEEISITDTITVGELAKKLNIKANDVIGKLMKMGEMVTINQTIDSDTALLLAAEYGTEVKVVSLYDETVIKQDEKDLPEDYGWRSPVVTVMGHVDHGKTKLLDAIREPKVAESEHGGITQHIGAYVVDDVNGKAITFLDTPGHAAFTTMRARGAQITDIVILVVAANDGVMPQTIEAIAHAKAAGVPIIVAINKIDLEDANIDKVRTELAAYDLIPEDWGGTTLFAQISAKKKLNINELLELVLIQAEMLELKENPKLMAKGVVIESKLDSGRGAVSTILIKRGTLHVGDPFVVGHYSGKVRAMFDDRGREITEAGPSTPVEILGISGVPAAGDPFECVDTDRTAKQVSQKRLEYLRIESAKKVRKVTLESLNDMITEGEIKEFCIIVKADVDGSAQALTESLEKLSTSEVRVNVIHSGTGGINESDVMLASASNAIIIGYHVRPTGRVSDIASKEHVAINFYNIIFEATDAVKAAMEGMLSPEIKEEINGSGEVKQVFKISKIGTIAGAFVEAGKIKRKSRVRLVRDGVVIFDGELKSLKRFKDDASEVSVGQEFGFGLKNFNDIKEGDNFEAYELIEIAKTLS